MNISTGKLSPLVALVFFAALSGQLFASTFTVTSTDDPAFVDPGNCTSPNLACSLREALAAADLSTDYDHVVFDVDGPIYLTRTLTVDQPVTIDGGGETIVRVHQGYEIVILADRNDKPATPGLCGELDCPYLSVLQPTYYSERGGKRQMIEMNGNGSVVQGLVLDGSITPKPSDLGVKRIDFESNDSTDFFLYTIDGSGNGNKAKRWLVAGGVRCYVPGGTVAIIGNEFRNFNDAAVNLEGRYPLNPPFDILPMFNPVVTGNVISGGAAGQTATSADGIRTLWVVGFEVSDNSVTGFRNGLAAEYASGVNVNRNTFVGNEVGIQILQADSEYAPNVVENNTVIGNITYGIEIRSVLGLEITNNDVNENGSDPEFEGGILVVDAGLFSINLNTVEKNSGFGIVIDRGGGHTVGYNEFNKNRGAGIVLLNGTQGNIVAFNEANKNSVGVVAGFDEVFPSFNTYDSNTFEKNMDYDVLDRDPVCNDNWTANLFGTVLSTAGNCVE